MMRTTAIALAAVAAFAMTASVQAQDKRVTIKLSYWVPPTHLLTPGYKEWAASVEKASGGTIKTTLFPSSQLGSGFDHYDMVKRGVADMGLINPGYTAGRFPIIAASDLPFMNSNSLGGAKAITKFYQKYAAKEMSDVKMCHAYTHDIGTVHSVKKEIKVPADIKGMNIRAANETIAKYVTAMGGNPVNVPIAEAKDTLMKGITDGIFVTMGGVHGTFKFGEVTKYTLDSPLYVSTFTHLINTRFYDGLSAMQRKAIDDHCTPEWSQKTYRYWYEDDQEQDKIARGKYPNHVWTKIGPAEVAAWRKAAEPVLADWHEAVKKAGYDSEQVLKEFKDALKSENALF
ncbi:MAG: C4-dicarboxylate transporter [Rhodospirillales bacterium]|jgi:TRAP-type C4-dicarboxylate transport system substrate-binding protein|nr:C4-dicarboxylate transporter [Rhodospirillales bacterium]